MRPQEFYSNVSASSGRAGATDSVVDGEETLTMTDSNFDILEWHPAYQSCQRYFLDRAQYEPATQAVCALINIRLPFQRQDMPITSSQAYANPGSPTTSTTGGAGTARTPSGATGAGTSSSFANTTSQHPIYHAGASARSSANPSSHRSSPRSHGSAHPSATTFIPLIPYIRRLVVTNFDKPAILHGFFGDDYAKGVMPHVQCERRNYLFAAKSGGWRSCKRQYDEGSGGIAGGDESVPFMRPLDQVQGEELRAAEKAWSEWLAMEDWMVGPNAPDGVEERPRFGGRSPRGMADGEVDGAVDGEFRERQSR